jgi:hypothetical protein
MEDTMAKPKQRDKKAPSDTAKRKTTKTARDLTDKQLEDVSGGFDALSTAEAQALGKVVSTESSTSA